MQFNCVIEAFLKSWISNDHCIFSPAAAYRQARCMPVREKAWLRKARPVHWRTEFMMYGPKKRVTFSLPEGSENSHTDVSSNDHFFKHRMSNMYRDYCQGNAQIGGNLGEL